MKERTESVIKRAVVIHCPILTNRTRSTHRRCIIALGGGVILLENNQKRFKKQ